MEPKYRNGAKSAKRPADQTLGTARSDVRWFEPVLRALRGRFAHKFAAELAFRANRSERICEKWIARKGAPDGAALAALLTSDVGDLVLKALMLGCAEPWAGKLKKQILASQLRDQLRAAAEQLKTLEGDL